MESGGYLMQCCRLPQGEAPSKHDPGVVMIPLRKVVQQRAPLGQK